MSIKTKKIKHWKRLINIWKCSLVSLDFVHLLFTLLWILEMFTWKVYFTFYSLFSNSPQNQNMQGIVKRWYTTCCERYLWLWIVGFDINTSLFPSLVVIKQLPIINPTVTLDRILKAIIMNHWLGYQINKNT